MIPSRKFEITYLAKMDDTRFYSYLERKRNGEDFSTIRAELKSEGYSESEISKVIKEIDEELLLSPKFQRKKIHPKTIVGIGMGLVSALALLFGFHSVWVLAFFLGGLALIAVRTKPRNKSKIKSKWERH
ncbi:MAG: hypothetical protein Crog4KO_23770 [Crocinitomicaceae bacterium]